MIVYMDRKTMNEVYGEDAIVVYALRKDEHITIMPINDK